MNRDVRVGFTNFEKIKSRKKKYFLISLQQYQLLIVLFMNQNQKLAGIIKDILSKFKETTEFCEEVSMIDQLIKLALENPNLNEFEKYIINEFGVSAKVVYSFVSDLSLNPESKAILGRKLLILWIKYKIFDVIGVFKKADKLKRNKITDFLSKFDFDTKNIKEFIEGCFNAAGEQLFEEDIPEHQGSIMEGRDPKDLDIIFCPPPPPPVIAPIIPVVVEASYNPDKSINQSFSDMVADYKYFPARSIEHYLQRELIISFLQKNKQQLKEIAKGLVPEFLSAKCDISALEAIFKDKYGSLTGDFARLFRKMEADKQQKDLYDNLVTLKSIIMKINVLQLERLINKTHQAKQQIREKDVVFVVGTTGSGKSTNILRFLGYTLRQTLFKKLQTLVPVQRLSEEHSYFYTSPQMKSCTRYITSAKIPDNMYPKGVLQSNKNMVICDSPGFGDSAGVEVDIANGVGMIDALRQANSVRLVVLLPYEGIINERCKGAVDMGQIISSLFHDFQKVVQSIAFFFNKVPKDQIQQIEAKISNRLEQKLESDKVNQKMQAFLETLKQASTNQQNFIYPLQTDFKKIFSSIREMPAITEIKQNFRYNFTTSTKSQIASFLQSQKNSFKDLFREKNFVEARYHLELLSTMKSILFDDEKIKGIYNQILSYITQLQRCGLQKYENLLISIENGEENSILKAELKQAKQTITEINKEFSNFEGLEIISEAQIKKIIDQFKQKLRAKGNDPSNLNKRYKKAIETFSDEIDADLKVRVLESIGSAMSKEIRELKFSYDDSKFAQMGERTKKCKKFVQFITSLSPKHRSLQQFDEFFSLISEKANSFLTSLKEIASEDNKLPLTKRVASESKEKLMHLQAINNLEIIVAQPSLKEEISNFIKTVGTKCKKYIRELEDINFSINFDGSHNKKSEDEKILASKKNEIELLMDISPLVKEYNQRDFMYAKQNIARKLKENVEILNECINGLKNDRKEDIERTIIKVKQAVDIVIRCSLLVDDHQHKENSREIANSINKQFLVYLSKQKQKIKRIDIKLNQINVETLRQIEQQYKNNENYQKYNYIEGNFKNSERVNFKQLEEEMGQFYSESNKDDEERIKDMFESSKPTTLNWEELSIYYAQSISSKDDKGKRKKQLIQGQLAKLQKQYLSQLKQILAMIEKREEKGLNLVQSYRKMFA